MSRESSRGLRSCPVCGSDAVGPSQHEEVDRCRRSVLLRCGECETWRRLVVTAWVLDTYEQRLERNRLQIAELLQRLEHDDMVRVTDALVVALQQDLIGPDDFIRIG